MSRIKNALQNMSYENSPATFFKVFRTLVILLLIAVITLTILVVRNGNETKERFNNNQIDLTHRFDSLSTDFRDLVRADCPFLVKIYLIPNASAVRPPSDVTVELSNSARDAYYGKDCPEKIGPDGKLLGDLPKLDP